MAGVTPGTRQRPWLAFLKHRIGARRFRAAFPGNYGRLGGITSFTRADASTCATYVNSVGVIVKVATGILRDQNTQNGFRTILLENTQKQVVQFAEAITTVNWTVAATSCLVTTGITDPMGTTLGVLLDANSSTVSEIRPPTMTGMTGTASKLVTFCLKPDGAATDTVQIDWLGAARRMRVRVTWAAGVPTLTDTDGNTVAKGTVALANGWYFFWMVTAATVVPADTNILRFYPGMVAGTGKVNLAFPCVTDAVLQQSYIAGATTSANVTRASDSLTLGGTSAFSTATLYQHYFNFATQAWVGAASVYTSGATISLTNDRAYFMVAVVQGTQTAAQCRAILRGTFPS